MIILEMCPCYCGCFSQKMNVPVIVDSCGAFCMKSLLLSVMYLGCGVFGWNWMVESISDDCHDWYTARIAVFVIVFNVIFLWLRFILGVLRRKIRIVVVLVLGFVAAICTFLCILAALFCR